MGLKSRLMLAIAASCFASGAAFASIDEICAAGASEPKLIWYSSQDPSRNDAALAAFRKAYPKITIEAFRLATGQLAIRYASERQAGVINADIISLADPNFIADGFGKDWFVQFAKTDLPALAALDDRWFQKGSATTSISVLGYGYNSQMVGAKPPATWNDLLRPEYAGKIILGDPRAVPSYMALFRILKEELGEEFFTKLAAQKPVLVPSVVPATQQLAAGEVAIVVPSVLTTLRLLKLEGAPIEFVAPSPTTGNEFETVLSKGADSPNAAKCLYNFLFTEAGQKAYNGPTSVSPLANIPDTAPMPATYINPRILELPQYKDQIVKALGLK
ncbi:MAG: hypothetical protein BGP06_09865 [Rhizobiales bacterium 65-9]|nr:extracellular solute-binding protein [Hyphomicrobiales bacterium]OJY33204.1 MAG: hypothetical protein BGP06_09865 [Rhizobiales bacterium 65-9]